MALRGLMVNGEWTADAAMVATVRGAYKREASAFRDRVTADGSSGFPAEPGRYHLYLSPQCPWAWRTMLYRSIKRLQGVIGMSVSIPDDRREGWRFGDDYPGSTRDEVNGFTHLHRVYAAARPDYTGIVSVPVLWDNKTRTIVNNESAEIIRMLNSEFDDHTDAKQDYYPAALRVRIDELNGFLYRAVNDGVYRVGLATDQESYEQAYNMLFEALEELDARLGSSRYLLGNMITECDWRLLATLLRLDISYAPFFRCNKKPLADYVHLGGYVRDLYQSPGVAETVYFDHIYNGYRNVLGLGAPEIIASAPEHVDQWLSRPHGREDLERSAA